MFAKYTGEQYSEYSTDFLVEVIDPCLSATITIDPLILPSTVIDYEVGAFVKSIEIDDNLCIQL